MTCGNSVLHFAGGNNNIIFINTNFDENKIGFEDNLDIFKNYYYLDIEVVDLLGHPVSEATVEIINDVDNTNYKSINLKGESKTLLLTDSNGHSMLPNDGANSLAILDYWKTSSEKEEMSYTILAKKDSYVAQISGIDPERSWLRSDISDSSSTITLVLPITGESLTSFAGLDLVTQVGENVHFDGSGSTGENIVFYLWDFDASNGLQEDAMGTFSSHSYTAPGVYTVTLTIIDNEGNINSDTLAVRVDSPLNSVPTITSFFPGNNSIYQKSNNVVIEVSATDSESDRLTHSIIIDGSARAVFTNYKTSTYVWNTDNSNAGAHTIEAVVSDGNDQASERHTVIIIDAHPRWDVNMDGMVNILDVTLVGQNMGTENPNPNLDVNQDSEVNILDLALIGQHFGETVE
ncbi:PKD domain-containing protein [Methanococcoides sp. SA1]|nr:PKD domain-containing protein [Methanococcoides sp. SA1]